MVVMRKTGGGTEKSAHAIYQCSNNHIVQVFSGFRGICFSHWKDAPPVMDLGCMQCMPAGGYEGIGDIKNGSI